MYSRVQAILQVSFLLIKTCLRNGCMVSYSKILRKLGFRGFGETEFYGRVEERSVYIEMNSTYYYSYMALSLFLFVVFVLIPSFYSVLEVQE